MITHQKPTMEVADALYGVSMRGDGITRVISQRLRGQDVGGPNVGRAGGVETAEENAGGGGELVPPRA